MSLEIVANGAARLGINVTTRQLDSLALYADLLLEANRRQNLTAVRDHATIQRRHLLESLTLGALLYRRGFLAVGSRLLDLGSGAGLPGIPLAIAWPGAEWSLLEATGKKAAFLRRAVRALRLDRATVLEGRAEQLAHQPPLREGFDCVAARAVAPLPALVELGLPFLRLGGVLAAVKGSRAPEEVARAEEALQDCGGRVLDSEPLPGADPLRLVLIEKVAPTPATYPRPPGRPAASPLGSRTARHP